jgi:hypothetical protein
LEIKLTFVRPNADDDFVHIGVAGHIRQRRSIQNADALGIAGQNPEFAASPITLYFPYGRFLSRRAGGKATDPA